MITDWDDAYENGGYIPDADSYGPKWLAEAAAYRDAMSTRMETVSYGLHPRTAMDIFMPEGAPKGLMIYVHGGYWRSRDRGLWSHLAAGPVAHGWAVAMLGYVLCPEVRIADITQQIAIAVDVAAASIAGPVHITGHSAGGHLAARMGCTDIPLACADRVKRIVPISGVHDLRPLTRTAMNDDFHLSIESAAAESPALLTPRQGFDLIAWVGADERPEFVRQNALLANAWSGCFIRTQCVESAGKNHFTVIEGLADADDPLTMILVD